MVLILEPEPIVPNDYDGSPLEDSYILYPLIQLYDKLYEIPQEYLELISGIVVLNRWNKSVSVTKKIQKQFVSFFKGTPRESKKLIQLFRDAQYFDVLDDESYEMVDIATTFSSKIFFDFTLTDYIINLLVRHFGIKKTIGFRKIASKSGEPWELIADIEKYLNIADALYYPLKDSQGIKELSIADIEEHYQLEKQMNFVMISAIPDAKFVLQIKKEDESILSELIQHLKDDIGSYPISECSNLDFKLPSNMERLLVKNIDRLPSHKITELFNEVLTGEYKNKSVLLHTSKPLYLGDFPDLELFVFYSIDKRKDFYNKSQSMQKKRLEIVRTLEKDFKKILSLTSENKANIKKKINKIENLKKINHLFNPKVVNFWYDFESIKYPNKAQFLEDLLEEHSNYFGLVKNETESSKNLSFVIKHNLQLGEWSIIVNGELIKSISYGNSLGMKYLGYLIKYYRDGDCIEDNILQKIVLKWHNKGNPRKKEQDSIKKFKKPPAHSIEQALHHLFSKQCPELTPLKRFIHITTNQPGCWYEENLFVDCQIIDDQMPPKNE